MGDVAGGPAPSLSAGAVEGLGNQVSGVRAGLFPASTHAGIRYGLGGLTMMWAPGVPGYINHGPLSGDPGTPTDSGVAYGV